MKTGRRKISAPLHDLQVELDRLLRIDAENQEKFSPGPGRPATGRLSKRQLHILTEGIFLAACRQLEEFLRDVFLLYCQEKSPASGQRVKSYLSPKSFSHAEDLLKSAMPFLDWSSPDNLIKRAETYLENGFPIKDTIASRVDTLRDIRRLRNHIAHHSRESLSEYKKVLRKYYGVNPLSVPEPGEFLLNTDRKNPKRYQLLIYLEFIKGTALALA